MDAGKPARERLGPSPLPGAESAHVTSSSADDSPIPEVGAEARALPRGGPAPSHVRTRVETSEEPATMARMRVKEELAIVKMGGDSVGKEGDSCGEVIADHVYEDGYVGEGTVEGPRVSGAESWVAVGGAVDWGLQGCAHPDTVGAKGGE